MTAFRPKAVIALGSVSKTAADPFQPVVFLPCELKNMPNAKHVRYKRWLSMFTLMLTCAAVFGADSTKMIQATGTFQPDGPPRQKPVRIDAGQSCVVDMQQAYVVDGTLSGSFDIDFRILVFGPCGHPLGTFAEEWIARGTFVGSLHGKSTTAKFTYTALVKRGGEVNGQVVLGQGLNGELRIRGSFSDGKLTYEGQLSAIE